jgi:hypothetical protein
MTNIYSSEFIVTSSLVLMLVMYNRIVRMNSELLVLVCSCNEKQKPIWIDFREFIVYRSKFQGTIKIQFNVSVTVVTYQRTVCTYYLL